VRSRPAWAAPVATVLGIVISGIGIVTGIGDGSCRRLKTNRTGQRPAVPEAVTGHLGLHRPRAARHRVHRSTANRRSSSAISEVGAP
jgi:hypothetical protein